MKENEINVLINKAVKMATRSAINGFPLKRVVWIPPQSATQDWTGSFAVEHAPAYTASETPEWDRP